MPKRSPGARERGIGSAFRRIREELGLSQTDAAIALKWNKSRLSRIENGKMNISVEDIGLMAGAYGVGGDERDRLLEAAWSVDEPGWWERIPGITRDSAVLADYESEANELVSWGPGLVPGLLQTMDYAAAVMELYGLGEEDIGARIAARRERQKAVRGKTYVAYIGIAALRAKVGGARVMAAQLAGLLDRDDVAVRVVPESAQHLGQIGAFLLLRFPDVSSVVHVELLGSGVFHDTDDLTSLYERAVTQIHAVAMGETQSAHEIERIWKETTTEQR